MTSVKTKAEKLFILFLFGVIWLYLWLRAVYVPFVADEISTFFLYIQTGKFFPWNAVPDANNHILNSALSYLSYSVFGLSELSLRLPNLLFFPVFFYAVYKISGELRNRYISLIFILVLTLNHFFIEYSALTRGYGISMSLLMLSIWFTIQLVKYDSIKYYIFSLITIILYLTANLTLIYTALFTVFIITINAIARNGDRLKSLFSKLAIIGIVGLVPLAGFIAYLFKLKELNLLGYGITGTFWRVTIESLTFNSVGSTSQVVPVLTVLFFIVTIIIGMVKLRKTRTVIELSDPGFLFLFLLLFNLLMFISLHYLMGIKYPEDRIGLFFIPLLIGSLLFMIDYAVDYTGKRYLIFITAPLLYIPVFFIINLNLSYTLYWKSISIPERFYKSVKEETKNSDFPATIGSANINIHLWTMHNFRNGGECNLLNFAGQNSVNDDFMIINYDINPELRNLYDSLDYNPLSNEHLLRRKFPAEKIRFGHNDEINTGSLITKTYLKFYEGYINKIPGKEVLITLDMTFKSPEIPFCGSVVVQIFGKNHKLLDFTAIPLNRIKTVWDGSSHNFKYSIKTKPLPDNCVSMKVFLWDIFNQPYFIGDGEISAYYYK